MALKLKQLFFRKRTFVIGCIAIVIFFFVIKPLIFPAKTITSSTKVKRGDIQQELTLSGKIDADEKANLRFATGGQVSYIGAKEGDSVTKGQVLATLDQRQVKKTLQKYLNTYQKQRDTFDQTKDTYKDKITDDVLKRVFDQSQMDLNNTVLDVELQDISLQLSQLITPISGVITNASITNAGVNVLATQDIFEIINPETIYFSVNADQTEVTNLYVGKEGTIIFDSYPNEKIPATITAIAYTPKSDESGTVYEVKVNFSEGYSSEKYRLGMSGDMTFITNEQKNTLYIPLQYIKSDEKGKYVLTTTDKNKKTYITTGLESDTNIEITSGLSENQVVFE